jgi:hypothetical protein
VKENQVANWPLETLTNQLRRLSAGKREISAGIRGVDASEGINEREELAE